MGTFVRTLVVAGPSRHSSSLVLLFKLLVVAAVVAAARASVILLAAATRWACRQPGTGAHGDHTLVASRRLPSAHTVDKVGRCRLLRTDIRSATIPLPDRRGYALFGEPATSDVGSHVRKYFETSGFSRWTAIYGR